MKHNWLKWLVWTIISGATITISFYWPQIKDVPFYVLGFIWVLVSVCAVIIARRGSHWRLLWLYISVVLITFSGYEVYLSIKGSDSRRELIKSGKYLKKDKVLGYSPISNNQLTEKKYYKDQMLFNATYSFNEYGLRTSPSFKKDSLIGDCLFFGCSYTFGEGVADEATYPYQVGKLTNGRYRIFNFAYDGYGPHQMLAALEYGNVKEIVPNDEKAKYGFFLTFPDHVLRAVGWRKWDKRGPRYLLNSDGGVSLNGTLNDNNLIRWIQLSKTLPWLFLNYHNVGSEEIKLYAEIIAAAAARFQEIYPNGKFYVLFIDRQTELSKQLLSALQEKALTIFLMNEILSDPAPYAEHFRVHKLDSHPNALANKLTATFIAEKILLKHTEFSRISENSGD